MMQSANKPPLPTIYTSPQAVPLKSFATSRRLVESAINSVKSPVNENIKPLPADYIEEVVRL